MCMTWLIHICASPSAALPPPPPHSYVWRDAFFQHRQHYPLLTHMCDVTHSCVWHDSIISVTRLIHMCVSTSAALPSPHSYVWRDSSICIYHYRQHYLLLTHMCVFTHSYVWHDSLICVTRLIHIGASPSAALPPPHSYVCLHAFTCATWLTHMYDTTHSYVCINIGSPASSPLTCVTWLPHVCFIIGSTASHILTCVSWLVHMCDMTHSYVWHTTHSYRCTTTCSTAFSSYVCLDSFICMTWLTHTRDTRLIHIGASPPAALPPPPGSSRRGIEYISHIIYEYMCDTHMYESIRQILYMHTYVTHTPVRWLISDRREIAL